MISGGKAVHCFIICAFNDFKVSATSSRLHRFNFPVEFHCDRGTFLECPVNQIMIWFRCAGYELRVIGFAHSNQRVRRSPCAAACEFMSIIQIDIAHWANAAFKRSITRIV